MEEEKFDISKYIKEEKTVSGYEMKLLITLNPEEYFELSKTKYPVKLPLDIIFKTSDIASTAIREVFKTYTPFRKPPLGRVHMNNVANIRLACHNTLEYIIRRHKDDGKTDDGAHCTMLYEKIRALKLFNEILINYFKTHNIPHEKGVYADLS